LTLEGTLEPIIVALEVDNPGLANRLATLLADVPGLRLAATGETPDVALVLPRSAALAEGEAALTARELEVLTLLAEGASNKTIARQLGISVHTAKFHVRSLVDKLDATGRTDAAAHAARLRVLHF
jgi:DNA-binding CsgD family transcriptional regulator